MKVTLERMNHWIAEVPSRIHAPSVLDLSVQPQLHKWSKKEVLVQ